MCLTHDRVSFDFLRQAMNALHFGPTFILCVDKMYDESKSHPNGKYSRMDTTKTGGST